MLRSGKTVHSRGDPCGRPGVGDGAEDRDNCPNVTKVKITMTILKQSIPFRLINSTIPNAKVLDFDLPTELQASEPPEARGLARDEVRLMVSYLSNNRVMHTRFRNIEDFLRPGDLLVINTSGTMNAALNATRSDGTPLELHLSTHLPADLWTVEV